MLNTFQAKLICGTLVHDCEPGILGQRRSSEDGNDRYATNFPPNDLCYDLMLGPVEFRHEDINVVILFAIRQRIVRAHERKCFSRARNVIILRGLEHFCEILAGKRHEQQRTTEKSFLRSKVVSSRWNCGGKRPAELFSAVTAVCQKL